MLEILVVCLIVGFLAAIALGAFHGKDQVAMDAEAKTNARSLLTEVQACFTEREDYTLCDERDELDEKLGLAWGSGAGQVEVRRNGSQTTRSKVTIRASSRAATGGELHRFSIVKDADGQRRTCAGGTSDTAGGCRDATW